MKQLWGCCLLFLVFTACQNKPSIPVSTSSSLVFLNANGLQEVKAEIKKGNPYYVDALAEIVQAADKYLPMPANPVIHKSILPPSNNSHDYLSLAPYWWPDSNSIDRLPWIRKDGEVNPMTRGDNTDKQRLFNLRNALQYLTLAFYYTDEQKYANKAIDLLKIWFVDAETRVNPNVNFGQGIPGKNDGRPYGIIEWRHVIENIITTLQLLKQKSILSETVETAIQDWLNQYLDWLLHSELGQLAGATENNHANWYDYQVIGIAIYLDRTNVAKKWANAAKVNRIASQIEVDGSQPHELGRTKSLSY